MPIKTSLSYSQIGLNLKSFKEKPVSADEVPFQLLKSIGVSDTLVKRYQSGSNTVATFDGLLIKGTLAYKSVSSGDLIAILDTMKSNEKVRKASPAILAVSDGVSIFAYDPAAEESYENKLELLYLDYSFFTPLWGIAKYRGIEENVADVKAAEKMAKLHDEIRRENEFTTDADLHDLNIFMTRLLFCYFAEDTAIFEKGLFTESIRRFTKPDGSDLSAYLDKAFHVMDEKQRNQELNQALKQFPYVNGGLFNKKIQIPTLGLKARKLMLECGSLDWKSINPDIFGSMIQAVVTPELRSGLGMHYTSVPNIMKLIGPLFLDELKEEYNNIDRHFRDRKNLYDMGGCSAADFDKERKATIAQCQKLLMRMSKMKFFDPACGSGNFLIITYKNLRLLENQILRTIQNAQPQQSLNTMLASVINISQFYGIELDDFACETAVLSLWLAEHQMNSRFTEEFGIVINALPLKSNTNIRQGNACRVDWNTVCPHTPEEEVMVMGNPPYLGSRVQDNIHKQDLEYIFKKEYKSLDYISGWFYLGANYIFSTNSKMALVSTNSICQGEQVALLWKKIFNKDIEINFAHSSFKWTNNAKGQAAVIVVIIGMSGKSKTSKCLYTNGSLLKVNNISPYLTNNANIIVESRNSPISNFPKMNFGNMPADNGLLLFNSQDKLNFIQNEPGAEKYFKPLISAKEFLNGEERWCLWLESATPEDINSLKAIKLLIDKLRIVRLESSRPHLAQLPHLFAQITQPKNKNFILIPRHSSENREYIPIGYLNYKNIVHDSCLLIATNDLWLFGVLTSSMHMNWVKMFGGRIKTDYRYSAQICYNTFPFPQISDSKKQEIETAANAILDIRDLHCEKTLADLYDPEKMPKDLREAHHRLDLIVESCYQAKPFANDEERLECLFKLYEEMTK